DRGELSEAPGLAQQSAVPRPGKAFEVGRPYVGLGSGCRCCDLGGATGCGRGRGGSMVGSETGLAARVRVRSARVELLSEGGQSRRERDWQLISEPLASGGPCW